MLNHGCTSLGVPGPMFDIPCFFLLSGYGSIYFPGVVDLFGIDLDEIVHIRRKEVIVYPNDDDKPPLNEGLNRLEVQLSLIILVSTGTESNTTF